jgi:ATP phosphoribosyltransferase
VVTIALPKGRLGDKSLSILQEAVEGLDGLDTESRKLILNSQGSKLRFLLVKPSDVPTYVEYGVADMGIAGKDTLMEENRPLYEVLDLGFGKCKMAVAGFPEKGDHRITRSHTRVATKYPNIAQNYFTGMGETIEIIKLNGSVELGPLVGLSDYIVDIVESGRTLRENGLVVLEEICDISARLVVNRVSFKTKNKPIKDIIDSVQKVLEV